MSTEQRYRDNIEALKKRGKDQKAEIIRDIFRAYPEEELDPIPLSDVQSIAYEKMERGEYAKTTLANTRRTLYDSDSGSYGFFKHSKKGVKNYLQITELGREFNNWLYSDGRDWGKAGNPTKVTTPGLIEDPIVFDAGNPSSLRVAGEGLHWALVPSGVDIVWVEITEGGKKKPRRIKCKSEVPEMSEAERLKARLRELGEDI